MSRRRALLDWIDSRTGARAAVRALLEEPLPDGVGWWFVTGSVLLFLLGLQLLTGVALAIYYVPSPDHAYDSVRFIVTGVPFGGVVRGLHAFGASFIVVAAAIHMGRVVLFASYKRPREATWLTGVLLLFIILAFALTGYLLPWDQKAYWATTVTLNIAASVPVVGEMAASALRGGAELGALTLGRWYAAHVLVLPAALLAFVASHLYLMRRHGISGPLTPGDGAPRPFYPYHALKDTIAIAVVFALLLTLAAAVPAPLDPAADPADASYVPRPEWYFLSLFQLLKYFTGPFELVGTLILPGLVATLLLLLPFLDRSPHRHPLRRRLVTSGTVLLALGVAALTWLGLRDAPANPAPDAWGPVSIGGREVARGDGCLGCHAAGGVAAALETTRLRRDPDWVIGHVQDPEVIAPEVREPPPGGPNRLAGRAVVSYLRKVRAGSRGPEIDPATATAARVFATRCAECHAIDGEGDASEGGDLSRLDRRRDARWLRAWIADPGAIDPATAMPAFGDQLSEAEMSAIVSYLDRRR